MNRALTIAILLVMLLAASTVPGYAQKPQWAVGFEMGLSIVSTGGGGTTDFNFQTGQFETKSSGAKAGFQFGPTGEVVFSKQYGVRTAFLIGTQSGTPIEWQNLFRYYFAIKGSQIKPYAHAGFSLFFVTGGPYVGIPFGGGALFPIAKNLYIPADLTFGPIFGGGSTVFGVEIKGGIRYQFD
jgi:hypothetical protein